MERDSSFQFDEIGYWSEIKLDIVKDYASAYSQILTAQKNPSFHHVYIDAFAGAGEHVSKTSGDFILGSPLNALRVKPPFKAFYFVDLNGNKVTHLKSLTTGFENVNIFEGDCNKIVLKEIFPKVEYKERKRGLCLLDPYGLHLDWAVMAKAGKMGSIEIFLNFPVADINRNVLWKNPKGISTADIKRMTAFWGDDSWKKIAYSTNRNLFGFEEKNDNETVAEGFRKHLENDAGFKFVPKPLPMRNTNGAVVYYLYFASPNKTGAKIVEDIFKKYRNRGIK